MEVYSTDISERKEFAVGDDTLKMKECVNKDKHIYVYERYNKNGKLVAYEVIKAIKRKNPDGSVVYIYPGNELFGSKGFYISAQHANKKHYGIKHCIGILDGSIKEDWTFDK